MAGLDLVLVPEMVWDLCTPTVMVMERMHGVPISQVERLREAGVDIPKLARDGVTIFFTQVFRDGFFHADMHPGNIQVSLDPATFGRYIALDFGIIGTLTEFDKEYLAQNFIAFFRRDYKRVAELHVESGWVPPDTRVDALEGAIRAVCEPHFDRPLKDISLGQVLMRLFQTSRRFNVEIQPQLVLLQKTLLNIEGLGRQLDPELDLWTTAKPFLERWMNDQVGWRGLLAAARARGAALCAAAARAAAPGAPCCRACSGPWPASCSAPCSRVSCSSTRRSADRRGSARPARMEGFWTPEASHADLRLPLQQLWPREGRAAEALRPGPDRLPRLRRGDLCQAGHRRGLPAQGLGLVRDRFPRRQQGRQGRRQERRQVRRTARRQVHREIGRPVRGQPRARGRRQARGFAVARAVACPVARAVALVELSR
jgi:hypothetical protein